MTEMRFDVVPMKATVTPDGFIHDSPVLTRVGVFKYRDSAYPGGWRREFRSPEEVFKPTHLNSLMGVPITANHPQGMAVNRADGSPLTLGKDGRPWKSIGAAISVGRKDDNEIDMRGDVVVHHPEAIRSGAKELSLGYRCDIDPTPGSWNGENYDVKQVNLHVNHIACVPAGRAGTARFNLDAADFEEEEHMSNDLKLVAVRLDGDLEYQAQPEVAHALKKASDALAAQTARADAAEAKVSAASARADAAEAKVTEQESKISQIRADAVNEATARIQLRADAKSHGAEIRADAADVDVKKAVIAKLSPTVKLDGKDAAYVDAMYDIVTTEASAKQKNVSGQRTAATAGTRSDAAPITGGTKGGSAAEARQRMEERTRNMGREAASKE